MNRGFEEDRRGESEIEDRGAGEGDERGETVGGGKGKGQERCEQL